MSNTPTGLTPERKALGEILTQGMPNPATGLYDVKSTLDKLEAWLHQRDEARDKQVASKIFNLAHEYAREDKTMVGSESLRNYHYYNAIAKIGDFDGQ